MRLSIIVPVYNVNKYLEKCIDSLLHQDLLISDYEILLIDDGSSDGSSEIADRLAEGHDNIKVFHQENQGLSMARNKGLANSRGEYVQFVDSDDYLEPNILEALLNRMDTEGLDVLRYNYQNVNEQGEVIYPNKNSIVMSDYSDSVCPGSKFLSERLGYACYACQFIIKTSLVKNKILFKKDFIFEDVEWTPRLLNASDRVSSTGAIVYNYLVRQDSITKTQSKNHTARKVDAKLKLIDELKFQSASAEDKRWYESMIAYLSLSIITIVARELYECKSAVLGCLCEKDVFPLHIHHGTRSNLRKIHMINVSPSIFCDILHYRIVLC